MCSNQPEQNPRSRRYGRSFRGESRHIAPKNERTGHPVSEEKEKSLKAKQQSKFGDNNATLHTLAKELWGCKYANP
jgi:hypothetical protein